MKWKFQANTLRLGTIPDSWSFSLTAFHCSIRTATAVLRGSHVTRPRSNSVEETVSHSSVSLSLATTGLNILSQSRCLPRRGFVARSVFNSSSEFSTGEITVISCASCPDILDRVLNRRKESRKRNLCFHLPVAVPLNPTLRLLANDSSYVTMQHIYDEHCDKIQIAREDPQLAFAEKFESVYSPSVRARL